MKVGPFGWSRRTVKLAWTTDPFGCCKALQKSILKGCQVQGSSGLQFLAVKSHWKQPSLNPDLQDSADLKRSTGASSLLVPLAATVILAKHCFEAVSTLCKIQQSYYGTRGGITLHIKISADAQCAARLWAHFGSPRSYVQVHVRFRNPARVSKYYYASIYH